MSKQRNTSTAFAFYWLKGMVAMIKIFKQLQTDERLKSMIKKNNENYFPLTNDTGLLLSDIENGKNLNVCVLGAAGTGKTRRYIIPNMLQANTSYVCTSRSCDVLGHTKEALFQEGYIVKTIRIDEENSDFCFDDIDFGDIGEEKKALFIEYSTHCIEPQETVAALVAKIFDDLTEKSKSYSQGRLPIHVRFMLDE